MFKTFAASFRLHNTYRKNGIIFSLKSLPLIKRILPSSLYASRELGIIADVISGIIEFFSVFIGKAIYLLFVFTQVMAMSTPKESSFAHILIFTTIIGGFLNTNIFNPTKDKFYAIFIMKIDAREYAVTNYIWFLLKMLVGSSVFSLLFGRLCGASYVTCLVFPLYVICVKLCFGAITLYDCKKQQKSANENKFPPITWVSVIVLLLLAAAPYAGFALDERVMWILCAALIIPAVFSLRYTLRFDSYRPIYKELLRPENIAPQTGAQGTAQQLAMQKKISADFSRTSNKSGYKYFNELFMKRHSRLMTKSAKRITAGAVLLFAAAVAAVYIFPSSRPDINKVLMNYLPYFLFIMYLINRGRTITQAMFMNCDHSMLAYRFYRQPAAILSLFRERLKYIVLINLMPASVIAVALPVMLYITGGTDEWLNYPVLFVSIIAMSVFFSVHSMVLYYLLQPYNVNLETKNAAYGVLNWLTYMVCYIAIQVKLPTLMFGSAVSAFCIIYALVALLLAYRLAPRTFKLRN